MVETEWRAEPGTLSVLGVRGKGIEIGNPNGSRLWPVPQERYVLDFQSGTNEKLPQSPTTKIKAGKMH